MNMISHNSFAFFSPMRPFLYLVRLPYALVKDSYEIVCVFIVLLLLAGANIYKFFQFFLCRDLLFLLKYFKAIVDYFLARVYLLVDVGSGNVLRIVCSVLLASLRVGIPAVDIDIITEVDSNGYVIVSYIATQGGVSVPLCLAFIRIKVYGPFDYHLRT